MFGLFGVGNLGNEGSMQAVIAGLRTHYPHLTFSCVGGDPQRVTRTHGVPAVRMSGSMSGGSSRRALQIAERLVARVLDVPRTFFRVRAADVVVVPGMGVLEERLGTRPWGLPYWLFLVAAAGRLSRTPVVLISVGAEPIGNRATRWLLLNTARLATYCSYRDDYSRDAMVRMGVAADPGVVYPDVAFSLPAPAHAPEPGRVAVGVMAWYGPRDDAQRGAADHERYVDSVTRFVSWLIQHDRRVTLVVGDDKDVSVAERIAKGVTAEVPGLLAGDLEVAASSSLDELMVELAKAEVVVASRYHNVVCSLRVGIPTVSLSYGAKSAALMVDVGLGDYCQSVESISGDLLIKQLQDLTNLQDLVRPRLTQRLRTYELELQEQYERLSSVFAAAARTQVAGPVPSRVIEVDSR